MPQVSRPLIALLLGSVVFLALWMTALKPSSQGGGSNNATAFSPAIAAAKHAAGLPTRTPVHPAHAAPAAHHSPARSAHAAPVHAAPVHVAPAHAAPTAPRVAPVRPARTTPTVHHLAPLHVSGLGGATTDEQRLVAAVQANRVALVLFYNPASPQDVAQRNQLASLSLPAGVLKLAVSINQLADVPLVTNAMTVNESPTYALIDRSRQITTILGYTDPFELQQRVTEALAAHAAPAAH